MNRADREKLGLKNELLKNSIILSNYIFRENHLDIYIFLENNSLENIFTNFLEFVIP